MRNVLLQSVGRSSGFKKRSEAAKKAVATRRRNASTSAADRSKAATKAQASRTPKQRSAAARKAWQTRRASA